MVRTTEFAQCDTQLTESGSDSRRPLSFREKQVVRLIQQAKLNKEIAYELQLTEGTIKEYLNRIFRKLGVKNRTELAIWAITQRDRCRLRCTQISGQAWAFAFLSLSADGLRPRLVHQPKVRRMATVPQSDHWVR
jgi:DNA-binding CsgD family transcriptional regulator